MISQTIYLTDCLFVKSISTSPNNRRDYYDFDVYALIADIQSVDWEGELHTYSNVWFSLF